MKNGRRRRQIGCVGCFEKMICNSPTRVYCGTAYFDCGSLFTTQPNIDIEGKTMILLCCQMRLSNICIQFSRVVWKEITNKMAPTIENGWTAEINQKRGHFIDSSVGTCSNYPDSAAGSKLKMFSGRYEQWCFSLTIEPIKLATWHSPTELKSK